MDTHKTPVMHKCRRVCEPLSFSMGSLGGCEVMVESPSSTSVQSTPLTTNSLNRRKVKMKMDRSGARKSWTPLDKECGKHEFWASIREPYDYIMGTHLVSDIESGQPSEDQENTDASAIEMDWDTDDVSPNYVWSLSEFLDQYNELYEWLIQVQIKLYSQPNPPDKQFRMAQLEDLERQSFRRRLFIEKGEQVARRNPTSTDKIRWRINYLKNKWDQMLTALSPVKGPPLQETDTEIDLEHEENIFKTWLNTMESQIQPITCTLPKGCSIHTLQERYKDNQILLKDIEAHGPILKTVLRQYEQSAQSCVGPDKSPPSSTDPAAPAPDSTSAPASTSPAPPSVAAIVPRRAKSLEKRWHQIYLRSLEWRYYLEDAIKNFKEPESSCCSDNANDEPVPKCRRLSPSVGDAAAAKSRRPRRPRGWSEYEANASDAGSYIEDDYFQVIDSKESSPSSGTLRRKVRLSRTSVCSETFQGKMKDKSSQEAAANGTPVEDQLDGNMNGVTNFDQNKNLKEMTKSRTSSKSNGSKLLKTEKSSPNYAVFEFKHQDTDSDNGNGYSEDANKKVCLPRKPARVSASTARKRMAFLDDDEIQQQALQKIIDSAVLDQDWLDSNLTSDSEMSANADPVPAESNYVKIEEVEIKEAKQNTSQVLLDKESIHRLIDDAEKLVREPKSSACATSRALLKPLSLSQTNGETKRKRIKQWLETQIEESSVEGKSRDALDSCDASGELTSEGSDDSSDSDNDVSNNTQKKCSTDGVISSENTPTVEGLPSLPLDKQSMSPAKRLLLKTRKSQASDEPWSGVETTPSAKSAQSGLSSTESTTANGLNVSSDETQKRHSFSLSDSAPLTESASLRPTASVNASFDSQTAATDVSSQSPTITSTTLNHLSPNSIGERTSPSKISTSLRKRRAKLRRRSNQFLANHSDSGSEGKAVSKSPGKAKESLISHKQLHYSPYHLTSAALGEAEIGLPSSISPVSSINAAGGSYSTPTSPRDKALMGPNSSTSAPNGVGASSSLRGFVASPSLPSSQSTNGSPMLTPRGLARVRDGASHLEDVSSLSEQAWDPYQDFKYLSEPYSEDLDRDGARKLLDFGDDYRKYIDSDGSSYAGVPRIRRRSPPLHRAKPRPIAPAERRLRSPGSDSDSELDDLHHLIEESASQLALIEGVIDKFSYQAALLLDMNELLSTAKTNLKCLRDVLQHIRNEHGPSLKYNADHVKGLMGRWEAVESRASERQRQSTQLRQLQRQVKAQRMSMEAAFSQVAVAAQPHVIKDVTEIDSKVDELNGLVDQAESLRSELSKLNVLVHRFITDEGAEFEAIKDDLADLYQLWDEMHRRVNGELARLSNIQATWDLWEKQKSELTTALKEDSDTLKVIGAAIEDGTLNDSVTATVHDVAKLLNERKRLPGAAKLKYQSPIPETIETTWSSGVKDDPEVVCRKASSEGRVDDRLSDSGTSGYESCSSDDLSERERRLAGLKHLAKQLEANLVPGSNAWNFINKTVSDAEQELKDLQDRCRNLLMRTAESLDPTTTQPRFSSNSSPKRRFWSRESKGARSPRSERRSARASPGSVPPRREWLWRVVRAALPFQAAILLLVCVGCLLEPRCCDSLNGVNLSLFPQIRHVHGDVPI